MAKFVKLTRDHSGEAVFVNVDYIVQMEETDKYTILRMSDDTPAQKALTVAERALEILRLMGQ